MTWRRGSCNICPRLQIAAAVLPGATRRPASPAARIRPVPSGLRASSASAPSSTAIPATSETASLPPSRGEPSRTVTLTGASRRKNAAASPAMPPPAMTTLGGAGRSIRPAWQTGPAEANRPRGGPASGPGDAESHRPVTVTLRVRS